MPKRPLYTPPEDIAVGTSLGQEFMYADTLQEFFGEYHVYPNNAIYSDPEYSSKSKELIPYIEPLTNPDCLTYFKITKVLYNQYEPVTQFFVTLTAEDYTYGKKVRFFLQKINEPSKIYEVDLRTFKRYNKLNKAGPNGFLYRRHMLNWQLTGDLETVILPLNTEAIQKAEAVLPGIGTYLLTNPTEFAQIKYTGPINGLFTAGGEYKTSDGRNYIGSYHIRKEPNNPDAEYFELIPYVGSRPISGQDKQLIPYK